MTDTLTPAIARVLDEAASGARTPAVAAKLDEIRQRLDGPLRLAIAGKVKAGKSTLLNALLGEELAPTDAGECTRIVTWYQRADQPHVVLHPWEGPAEARPFSRDGGALDVDLGTRTPDGVDHLEVWWPTQRLRDLTLIDTPGIGSISAELSARTHQVLTPEDDRPSVADAVLYLLRHTHSSDIRFLESFHDDELAHGTPMNAVGVLSRADEIGACQLDALDVAHRVAARYQSEPRLRRLCPLVLPVAGLLAHAGTTLREQEYRGLATVAAASPEESGELLLTAERFGHRPSSLAITPLERQHLLERLGLFGVRFCADLIRRGEASNATALSQELVRRSGLGQLRTVLLRQFSERSRVLKARSALAALTAVIASGGVEGADGLRGRVEAIASNAHVFAEARLLNKLRSGELGLSAERSTELDQLLGGSGHDVASRLGLPDDADDSDVRTAALDALDRWHRIGEHPLSGRQLQLAARAVSRTIEGILADPSMTTVR